MRSSPSARSFSLSMWISPGRAAVFAQRVGRGTTLRRHEVADGLPAKPGSPARLRELFVHHGPVPATPVVSTVKSLSLGPPR